MAHKTPINTEVRRRVQQAWKTRDVRSALRNSAGAIDLASIMVGVLVIGVIAGIIAATVFAVIPWSQDKAAKQSLSAVRGAESVAYTQGAEGGAAKYQDKLGLITSKLIQDSPKIGIATDADGTCYVGVSKSATGKIFYLTNKGPDVAELTSTTDPGCGDPDDLVDLVDTVGGPDGGATAPDGGTSGNPGNPGGPGDPLLTGTATTLIAAKNTAGVSSLYAVRGTQATALTELTAYHDYTSLSTMWGGKAYLIADTPAGSQLLSTNGTTVTVEATLNPNAAYNFNTPVVYAGKLYFTADRGTGVGEELYSFDGSAVSLAADINPGAGNGYVHDLMVYNGELVFGATNGVDSMIYAYNGSAARIIGLLSPGTGPTSIAAAKLSIFNGKLMHVGVTNKVQIDTWNYTENRQLWEYNGADGTDRQITNINPTAKFGGTITGATVMGDRLYFSAVDKVYGRELHSYDGSGASGVLRLTDLSTGVANGISSSGFLATADRLYFASERFATAGSELWMYQTGTGAELIVDANPGSRSSYPSLLGVLGGSVYAGVATDDLSGNNELHKFDGSTLTPIEDLAPGSKSNGWPNSSDPTRIGVVGPYLYFQADPDGTEDILYATSGGSPWIVGSTMKRPRLLGTVG